MNCVALLCGDEMSHIPLWLWLYLKRSSDMHQCEGILTPSTTIHAVLPQEAEWLGHVARTTLDLCSVVSSQSILGQSVDGHPRESWKSLCLVLSGLAERNMTVNWLN